MKILPVVSKLLLNSLSPKQQHNYDHCPTRQYPWSHTIFPPLCPAMVSCPTWITLSFGTSIITQHHHDGLMAPGLALLTLSATTSQPTNINQQRCTKLVTYRPLSHLWDLLLSMDLFRKYSHRKIFLKVTQSKWKSNSGSPGVMEMDCPSIASTDWYSFPILADLLGFFRHGLLFHLGTSFHLPESAKSKSAGSDTFLLETVVLEEDKVGFGKMECFCLLKSITELLPLIHFHIISKLIKFLSL